VKYHADREDRALTRDERLNIEADLLADKRREEKRREEKRREEKRREEKRREEKRREEKRRGPRPIWSKTLLPTLVSRESNAVYSRNTSGKWYETTTSIPII
jgi:hypothetical protein